MDGFTRRTAWLATVVVLAAARAYGDEVPGLEYPSFGVSLVGPAGWAGKFVPGKYVVARWEREDWEGPVRGPRAVVEVRALPAAGMTLGQFADLVGGRIGGAVVDKSLKVDGAAAWRLEAPRPEGDVVVGGDSLRLRGAVVVEHEGVMYAVLGGGLPWEDWRGATRQVLERWKWVAIEPPAKHLRWLDARAVLLRGRVVMPLPVGMGVAEPDRGWNDAAGRVSLGLYNFKRGGDDFAVSIAVDERRDGETIEAYRERLMPSLRARADGPIEWRELEGREARRVTPLMKVAGPADGGGEAYEQYACVEADDGQVVVVRFTIVAAGEEEREFYERQAGYMLREMEVPRGAAPFGSDRGR